MSCTQSSPPPPQQQHQQQLSPFYDLTASPQVKTRRRKAATDGDGRGVICYLYQAERRREAKRRKERKKRTHNGFLFFRPFLAQFRMSLRGKRRGEKETGNKKRGANKKAPFFSVCSSGKDWLRPQSKFSSVLGKPATHRSKYSVVQPRWSSLRTYSFLLSPKETCVCCLPQIPSSSLFPPM